MWYCPEKYDRPIVNINEESLALKGELGDRQAKITLAKFMRSNLGFTTELLSGIKLALYQEITLKAFFNASSSAFSSPVPRSLSLALLFVQRVLFLTTSKRSWSLRRRRC